MNFKAILAKTVFLAVMLLGIVGYTGTITQTNTMVFTERVFLNKDATGGVEAVSYRTLDTLYSNSVTMTFTGTNVVQSNGSNLVWNTYMIVNGRVYIGDTNGLTDSAFSQPSMFTIRSDGTMNRDAVLYRWTNVNIYATTMTNSAGAGTNLLDLADASGIPNYSLLYLMDSTPEFVGVTNIIGNTVYLENATVGSHASASGVSLVREFATPAYDATLANKVWYALRFNDNYSASNITVSIKYKK
jgi:hypothetical protein